MGIPFTVGESLSLVAGVAAFSRFQKIEEYHWTVIGFCDAVRIAFFSSSATFILHDNQMEKWIFSYPFQIFHFHCSLSSYTKSSKSVTNAAKLNDTFSIVPSKQEVRKVKWNCSLKITFSPL